MELQKDRPPYVEFVIHAVEDREASITAGCYVAKDVIFAHIMPFGGKDIIEREAEEWLGYIDLQARAGRFERDWVKYFRQAFKDFKEGLETPRLGTPITNMTTLSPADIVTLKSAKIYTIEDLASLNEDWIKKLPGARKLKQRAENWLQSTQESGKVSMELEKLRTERDGLLERTNEMEKRLKLLETQLEAHQITSAPIKAAQGSK